MLDRVGLDNNAHRVKGDVPSVFGLYSTEFILMLWMNQKLYSKRGKLPFIIKSLAGLFFLFSLAVV